MTLRPGTTADDLREKVTRLDTAAGNIASAGTTAGPLRDAYITWVEDVERTLQPYVTPEWLEGWHSERYWKIRDIDDGTLRPWPLIDAEIKRQQGRLAALIVQAERAVPAAAPATTDETVVIEDTNAHLHFVSFDQIDWQRVAGVRHVLLAVPLAVIEELDNHKNRGGPLGDRADGVTKRLFKLLDGAGTTPVDLKNGVRICLLADVEGQARTGNNDEDILDRVQAHADAGGRPVVVVTGDQNMRLRAQVRGMFAIELPAELRLPAVEPADRRIRQLEADLHAERAKAPKISLTFHNGAVFLDPPSIGVTPELDAYTAIEEAAAQGPPTKYPAGRYGIGMPSQEAIERYKEDREVYRVALRSWTIESIRRDSAKAGGVPFELVAVNSGAATAEDVEVKLELITPTLQFATVDALDVGEPPEPPTEPGSLSVLSMLQHSARAHEVFDPTLLAWRVEGDGTIAVLAVPQVRHGGSRLQLPRLYLVTDDGAVNGGARIEWTITGVRPPVEFRGDINIRPRRGHRPA